jgi:monoamine oxidase
VRVVVVGAGLSGLNAARHLRAGGAEVEIVEAGPRLGGRARTVRTPFAGGQHVETGAEWVDTDHHRILELLDRYGLSLEGAGQHWSVVRRLLHRDGRLLSPDEIRVLEPELDRQLDRYDALVRDIAAGIVDPQHPDLHPEAEEIDGLSLADLADRAGLGEIATLFARRNSQGEWAAELGDVSALFVAQQRAHLDRLGGAVGVTSHRVVGGLDQLVAGLAGELDCPVSLGESLVAVDWDDRQVRITTSERVLQADHVVLACSLVPLRRVRFTPELPEALRRAVDELGYGTVTKTALQYPTRSWPDGFVNTELPSQRVYEPTVDQPGEQGVLMAYTGGSGGRFLAGFDEAERMRLVAEDQRAMYGLPDAPLGGCSRAWSAEPRYGGSYAVYRPGQVTAHWQVLREPCGPLHLAGEHVATCTGYLEGALESGETVATRLLSAGA